MSLYRLNEDCYYEEDYETLNEFRNPFKKKSKTRKALDFAKKHKYAVGTGLVLASPFALRGAKAGAKYTGKKLSQANRFLADKHPGIHRYAKDLGLVGAGAAVLGASYLDAKKMEKMNPVERQLYQLNKNVQTNNILLASRK